MPTFAAAWLFIAFILWLFIRDARQRTGVSGALWIPLSWVFIIGTKPVSVLLNAGGSFVDANGYLEDGILDKGIFFFLICAGLLVLIRRGKTGDVIRRNKWLILYFIYLALSVLWADDVFTSFKRWFKDFGHLVMVMVVLTDEDPVESIKTLLARTSYLMIPLSVLVVKYYPRIGRSYDRWTFQPQIIGLTSHKNLLGMTLFICGLALFWMLLELFKERKHTKDNATLLGLLALGLMTAWLLHICHSATALVCTLLGSAVLMSLQSPAVRNTVKHLGTYLLTCAILVGFLQLSLGLVTTLKDEFVEYVGRDPTLHGRDAIWQAVLSEDINPLIGVGFYSFWSAERNQRISTSGGYFYNLGEAHNGYIEIYLNGGLIGLVLFIAVIFSAAKSIKREVLHGLPFGSVRLVFLLNILIYGISESIFDRMTIVWFAMILVMMEHMPARQERPVLERRHPAFANRSQRTPLQRAVPSE